MSLVRPKDMRNPETLSDAVVLLDSLAAAEAARRKFGPGARFYTFSPAVVLAQQAQSLECGIGTAEIRRISDVVAAAGLAVFRALRESKEWSSAAISIARLVPSFEVLVYRAALIAKANLPWPLIAVQDGLSAEDPAQRLLPHIEIDADVGFQAEVLPQRARVSTHRENEAADMRTRLTFEGTRSIGYRLLTHLSKMMAALGSRTILIPRESALVKEIAFELGLRGFRLLAKPLTKVVPRTLAEDERARLEGLIGPIILTAVLDCGVGARSAALVKSFCARAAAVTAAYRGALPEWRRVFASCRAGQPAAVLTNHFNAPSGDALYELCREREVPHFTCQHGITPEFSPVLDSVNFTAEIVATDGYLAFSDRMAEWAEQNPYRVGRAFALGTPNEMVRIVGRRRHALSAPILYVSTQALLGTRMRPVVQGTTDIASVEWETRILERVLDRLPHRVVYKPYRSVRYGDGNPAHDVARRCRNIVFFEEWIDLRYIVTSADVIIVAHTGSTFHWCVASGRPLVYIHSESQWPLRPEARAALEASVFFFDDASPRFVEDLCTFLSRPIPDIERAWGEKAAQREKFRQQFMGNWDSSAGRRGAQIILEAMARR